MQPENKVNLSEAASNARVLQEFFDALPSPIAIVDLSEIVTTIRAGDADVTPLRFNGEAHDSFHGGGVVFRVFGNEANRDALSQATTQASARFTLQCELHVTNGAPQKHLAISLACRRFNDATQPLDRIIASWRIWPPPSQKHRPHALVGEDAQHLFEMSPVSLWLEDFSAVKIALDELRGEGVKDFRAYCAQHPTFVKHCMQLIDVIDVNQQTLTLFEAPNKKTLYARLNDVFRDDMSSAFQNELLECWNEKLFQTRETVNYTLSGKPLDLHIQWSVVPGHEATWDRVQVALVNITDRKRAEARMRYLGQHDVLTALKNRAFYQEQLAQFNTQGPFPIGVIVVDVNGLKPINDRLGHSVGDSLLQRAATALTQAVDAQGDVARMGGDEFACLLPHCDESALRQLREKIDAAVNAQNKNHDVPMLSMSVGYAVCEKSGELDEALRRADVSMYAAKRTHYQS